VSVTEKASESSSGLLVGLFDDTYFVISGRPRSVRYLAKKSLEGLTLHRKARKETYLLRPWNCSNLSTCVGRN
jgi:hypothetical protein